MPFMMELFYTFAAQNAGETMPLKETIRRLIG